jgi:ABC-2 type transport system ATP-binding protein
MNPILKVNRITKDFLPPLSYRNLVRLQPKPRKPTQALEDVSFTLERGKILGILGPNGAGKTTLLKIIATLILPDKGSVSVNGSGCEEKIKSAVGLLLDEERSFYWRLSGRQNLEFFSALYGMNKQTAAARINALLDLFSVDYADKRFDAYSTGMKRNFALMRALLHNPQLLLLDEPTKSLDYTSSINLKTFVQEELVKKQNKTVIFTTHNLDEAQDFGEDFLVLHQGRIYGKGSLGELRKQINNPQAELGEIFLRLTEGIGNV